MKHASFTERYGPWALITGGASGIGAEFGHQLAARGLNIVLIDVQAGFHGSHTAGIIRVSHRPPGEQRGVGLCREIHEDRSERTAPCQNVYSISKDTRGGIS